MLAPVRNIALNKGNSGRYKVKIYDQNDNIVVLEDTALLYFTVKETPYAEEYVFQKILGNGITFSEETNVYTIEVTCDDTDPLFYKDYFYDLTIVRNVGLESANKKEKTTVLIGDFTIGHVATFKENEVTQ